MPDEPAEVTLVHVPVYAMFVALRWYGTIFRVAEVAQAESLSAASVARTRQTSDLLKGNSLVYEVPAPE